MDFDAKLKKIQRWLRQENMDGWLLYDHHGSNRFAHIILGIPPQQMLTRRFFYWIPVEGKPHKLLHHIEVDSLDFLPGKQTLYLSWTELQQRLGDLLKGINRIIMEYSPGGSNPYVSTLDAGTYEAIRFLGVTICSSSDLLQTFTSVLTEGQMQLHREASQILKEAVAQSWTRIAYCLQRGLHITEYDVQQSLLKEFVNRQCATSEGPICAINVHSAIPHYVPTRNSAVAIKWGDWILIDLWCKRDIPEAIYADITQVAVAAPEPTAKQQEIFTLVKEAQKQAVDYVIERLARGYKVCGAEVDDLCRGVIKEKGYGAYFTHRTGHNIDTNVHGAGAHLDNFETSDYRQLLPGMCFTIEPGIYLPGEFGVRLETNILIRQDHSVEVTGGMQESIICLLDGA